MNEKIYVIKITIEQVWSTGDENKSYEVHPEIFETKFEAYNKLTDLMNGSMKELCDMGWNDIRRMYEANGEGGTVYAKDSNEWKSYEFEVIEVKI